nr:serine hydrolase [Allomuricauda sp.]
MKLFKRILLLLLIVIAIAVYLNYPKLNIISGYASKYMASGVFLAGRSEASLVQNDTKMPMVELAECEVNQEEKSASASVYGLMDRKAVYREGLGAVLVKDGFENDLFKLRPKRLRPTDTISYPYGQAAPKDTVFPEIDYNRLNSALDLAFDRPDVQKTRTVVILYKGHLIAERYLDGFTKETPVLGWSMTKSILGALYGILQHQGKLETDWPAPIPEWKNDERSEITLNHLLRMQSGLEWEEDYGKISDVTRMLFLEDDMTLSQKKKEAIAKPTEIWNYSSGTTNLLSGILRQQFRGHQEYLDFPYEALIDKIGMYSMVLEADVTGNYVLSSYAWANTRDWARFGQLHLDKGQWGDEQIFDASWIDYIIQPTINSEGEYGAHYWLNSQGKYPDVPRDLFSCNGFQGQYVFMIPSKDMVIVRTGLAEKPDFDANRFLSEVTKSVGSNP